MAKNPVKFLIYKAMCEVIKAMEMQRISDNCRTFISILWQFEGLHYYVNAPNEVAFLRLAHRHLFKCRAEIEVFHDDREIEFLLAKRYLVQQSKYEWEGSSCEGIAKYFVTKLIAKYGERAITVEVSEDGENSAKVFYR